MLFDPWLSAGAMKAFLDKAGHTSELGTDFQAASAALADFMYQVLCSSLHSSSRGIGCVITGPNNDYGAGGDVCGRYMTSADLHQSTRLLASMAQHCTASGSRGLCVSLPYAPVCEGAAPWRRHQFTSAECLLNTAKPQLLSQARDQAD